MKKKVLYLRTEYSDTYFLTKGEWNKKSHRKPRGHKYNVCSVIATGSVL